MWKHPDWNMRTLYKNLISNKRKYNCCIWPTAMICPDDEMFWRRKVNCSLVPFSLLSFCTEKAKPTKLLTNSNCYSIFFYILFIFWCGKLDQQKPDQCISTWSMKQHSESNILFNSLSLVVETWCLFLEIWPLLLKQSLNLWF